MASTGQFVSASAMARHLFFERAMLDKLLAQGVIERQGDGRYELDSTRAAYIRHLREARRVSPRSAADAEFTKAKAELIALRIGERKKELMLASECYELQDEMFGLFMTALSSLPTKIGGRDLAERAQGPEGDLRHEGRTIPSGGRKGERTRRTAFKRAGAWDSPNVISR